MRFGGQDLFASRSRWQWAGLGALLVVFFSFVALFQFHGSPVRDSLSVSLDNYTPPEELISHPTNESATTHLPTSKFHFLAPASGKHFRLCRAIASGVALGYPAPVFNGWMKKGDLDASKTHLAKVRTVLNYLQGLPSEADDDLVLMIDSYDVVFQYSPDVLIDRYFALTKSASTKIASRFGVDAPDGLNGDDSPRLSIVFGPEKVCFPPDEKRIGCWAAPENIDLPNGAFGAPADGGFQNNPPRWLNSGTIMGPVGDMRRMFKATLDLINETYDPNHEYPDSDQRFLSDLWGAQEYWRSVNEKNLYFHGDVDPLSIIPEGERVVPMVQPEHSEYHMGVDHRSSLFQTRVGSDHVLDFLKYSETSEVDKFAWVDRNVGNSDTFKKFKIMLPVNLESSVERVLKSISGAVEGLPNITEISFHSNLVTKHVYGLFHCIGDKDYIDDLWSKLWFYKWIRPLFEAGVDALKKEETIAVADGRAWKPARTIPRDSKLTGVEAYGAWADTDGGWLPWQDLCGEFEEEVFGEKTHE